MKELKLSLFSSIKYSGSRPLAVNCCRATNFIDEKIDNVLFNTPFISRAFVYYTADILLSPRVLSSGNYILWPVPKRHSALILLKETEFNCLLALQCFCLKYDGSTFFIKLMIKLMNSEDIYLNLRLTNYISLFNEIFIIQGYCCCY